MPRAEVKITTDLVAGLVRAQHPDLLAALRPASHGWDNVVYRLGDRLAVRLPRRAAAAGLIVHEQRWLPVLRPWLRLPVPVPVRIGQPSDDFPWSWSITPWFPGRPLAELLPPARRPYAASLGDFLAALHRPAPDGAPRNPVRGIPLADRTPALRQHLQAGVGIDGGHLLGLWEEIVTTPAWTGEPCWLHGDPHPANLLVDGARVAAVIDFGDLTAGDPATDLALGWLAFDGPGRDLFRRAYAAGRELDPDTWQRARGWALALGIALLANSDDNPVIAGVGRHALAQVTGRP